MKPWVIAVGGFMIAAVLLLTLFFSVMSDTREYAILVELTDPYPKEYLPISEWELIGMPELLYAMNHTGIQKTLRMDDWQEIHDYLQAVEGVIEFAGDFYYIYLLRT